MSTAECELWIVLIHAEKKRVVCEVLQVLKYPLIVLRVAFVEAGMEFNVRKT